MVAKVQAASWNRPHLVDSALGFLCMEVISSYVKPEESWLVPQWEDEKSFQVWHESHAYREFSKGIPKGLKLVPKTTEIRRF